MFNHQHLTHEIVTDPQSAKAKIMRAYEQAKCSLKDAAKLLACGERTLHGWVQKLALQRDIEAMKKRAEDEGWHHNKGRQGGRPPAAKKTARRARK